MKNRSKLGILIIMIMLVTAINGFGQDTVDCKWHKSDTFDYCNKPTINKSGYCDMHEKMFTQCKGTSSQVCRQMTTNKSGYCEKHEKIFRIKDGKLKNPGVAVLLSAVLPAGGQFYNGDIGKAFGFLLLDGLGIGIMVNGMSHIQRQDSYQSILIGDGILLVSLVWSMIDAGVSASNYTKAYKMQHQKGISINPYYGKEDVGLRLSLKF